jgi:Ribbon-helix-helix protein, copG family
MVRTQIQLTENQLDSLKRLSASSGRSIADLIREAVDLCLRKQVPADSDERIKRALGVAGRFSSGASDVSAHHDEYLVDAFKK